MQNSNSKDGTEVPQSENVEVPTSSQTIAKPNVMRSLSNGQIEMIADIFSKKEQIFIDDRLGAEWILCHAFQLGAKFYRDFTNCA